MDADCGPASHKAFMDCRGHEQSHDLRQRIRAAVVLLQSVAANGTRTAAGVTARKHLRTAPRSGDARNTGTINTRKRVSMSDKKIGCPARALTALLNKCTQKTSHALLIKYCMKYGNVLAERAATLADVVIAKCVFHPQFNAVYRIVLQQIAVRSPAIGDMLKQRLHDMQNELFEEIRNPPDVVEPSFFPRLQLILTAICIGFVDTSLGGRLTDLLLSKIDEIDEIDGMNSECDVPQTHATREVLLRAIKHTVAHLQDSDTNVIRQYMTKIHERIIKRTLHYDNKCRFMVLDLKL